LESLLPAKIGSVRPTSRSADNFIIPKSRTETFKRSFIPSSIKLYNELDHDKRNYGHLKEISRAKSCNHFGNRNNNIKHAQLRMECSKLNHHLFLLHVLDSPRCYCGFEIEDTNHYFMSYPLYTTGRTKLLAAVHNIMTIADVDTLLYGCDNLELSKNKELFIAVHTFISESARL